MRIAILGAGNVGGTLGRVWTASGHDVTFAVRDPRAEKTRELVASTEGKARAAAVVEAVKGAEVVLLATPWSATRSALESAGSLAGKVLIDATNPLKPDLSGLSVSPGTSAAEEVAKLARGARVVKAFNTIGSMHMDHPEFGGERPSMFVCGDDPKAKVVVFRLAEEAGFEPLDAGPLTQARLLEPLALLWISLAYAHGLGTGIAFRLLRK